MDATQAIVFSDEESEEEHDPGQKKAVAFLHVLAQKDLSAYKHPIYEGDNFIGRHDSNSIHMPYKALSKQHSCIEVQGNSHLIYDMESRNKTRRGKMFLKPNVRYELRDSDVIIFGDVKCQYIIQPEQDDGDDDDETGSETDSELMLQRPDSEDTGQDDKYSKEDENENDSSFNLNDFLQPTQPCGQSPKLEFKTPRRLDEGKVFAADSDDESPNKSNASGFEDDSFIPETQLSAKKKNDFSVVEESDSDTDIDETGPFDISALASAQTQAVVATQAVDNMATQAVDGMETQAIDNMETQAIDNMATLAVDSMATLAVDRIETQAVDDMATQAVDNMETQAIDNTATLAVDNMETQAIDNMATSAVDNAETQAIDNMATLAVDSMATQAVDNMATQAVDNMATQAVDNMATQAVDNMATQAVDNMATQAVDNIATQAVDYSADSDSSDTDLDEVGQSMLEAPTQAVGLNDSRQQGTPKKFSQTLVLDSSTASSDVDDSPIKQARSGRNIFDEPTQVCEGIVSDSGSETDIEEGGMEEDTQAVIGHDENKIDEMATVAIGQDDDNDDATDEEETMETGSKMLSSDKTGDVENMATVPMEMDDDETDVEDNEDEGVKGADSKMIDTAKITGVEDMATVPVAMADDDDDDIDDTDVEEVNKDEEEKSAIKDTKMKDGNNDVAKEDGLKLAPQNPDRDDDNIEMESEMNGGSQEYFLNYRTEQNPVEKEGPGPCEIEATQPYEGPSDDTSAEDAPSSNLGDGVAFDATQPYGEINEDKTPEETTPPSSVTLEMSSTQPYGAGGENNESCTHDDETDPTVPYGAEEDIGMETGDGEIESTQAYGMQGSDTQVPDSQDGDDQATTSSRFPVFKAQSPSRSCLKQPNTPERKATKARRVTFEPADSEEEGQSDESDGECETQKSGRRSQRQPKKNKSSVAPKSKSPSTGARRSGSRVSKRSKDEDLDTTRKDDATAGRRGTRSKAENDEVTVKPGQKRKVGALELVAADSSAQTTKNESAKRGKRQRGGKVAEEPDGDLKTVDELLTMTDAKPTRKKEFDAENPRPSSRRGSNVKDERKLSDSSISSVGSEVSSTGRVLQTIVQIGKNLTRISKWGKKTSEEESATTKPVSNSVGTRRSQRIAEVVDDGDSDDTASISSTASSIRDFAEVEASTRATRGTRNQKGSKKVAEEHDGPSTSGLGVRRSRRGGGTGKEEMSDSQDSEKKAGSRTRRGQVAMETVETEVDGQSTQSSSRTQRKGGAKGDETASQDDCLREVSKRVGRGEKTDSQNDGEVRSKRTKRGTVPEVNPDTQEKEPVKNKSRKTVELESEATKPSRRGKTKAQISGDGDQGVHEDKESQDTSSRRSRRATSESQEKSTEETEETDVRHSGRRRTMPARFLDSEGTDKATGSQTQSSKQEAKDTSSTDAGVFAVPKAMGRPSRQKQQKESSSSQKEIEAGTVTSSRGRRSSANVAEPSVEKEKESKESRKRGRHVPAIKPDTLSSVGESKAEENTTTPIQRGRRATTKNTEPEEKGKAEPVKIHSRESTKRGRQVIAVKQDASSNKEGSTADENTPTQRGRRPTTKLAEASAEMAKSEDVKEGSSSSNKRGRQVATPKQKPAEESAADDSMATLALRGRRTAAPATASKTSKDSKDIERKELSTEQDKSTEVVKTRGKRGAAATPPQSSPAKKPRQATLPTSKPSPSASPARRSHQHTDQISALSPSLRRRVSDTRPKVMFTGVMDDSWQKTVTTLGGELVDSVHDCTHLITDKVRRTVKFLCCVARGVTILTPNWLDESKAAKMFIDAGPFQLKDKASERQHGFNLLMSLQKAGQARLLKGYKIHVTPGVKPEPQQMKDIIKCAGGEFVAKLPTKSIPQMVVVSCDDDKSLWVGPTKVGVPVVSPEFILTGILRQEILLKDYKLK